MSKDATTVGELLQAVIDEQGHLPAMGIAMSLWSPEGKVLCQYTGSRIDISEICRLLLSGAMELTHRMGPQTEQVEQPTPSKPSKPKIELV